MHKYTKQNVVLANHDTGED